MRKKVSIKNAVNEAMDNMGSRDSRDIPVLTNWAIFADRRIGTSRSYKLCCKAIDVIGCHAELPCECIIVESVAIGDYTSEEWTNIWPSTIPVPTLRFQTGDGLVLIDNGGILGYDPSFKWSVQNNTLQLSSAYSGMKITVRYRSYYMDSDGFPMIDAEHIEAVAQFLMFRVAQRSRFKTKNKMPLEDVQLLEEEWHRLCRHARAQSTTLEGDEKDNFINDINNPLSGHGINLPINNPNLGWI